MVVLNREFVRFVGVGAINTLVGLLVIFGTKAFLYDNDVVANAVGYGTGLSVSFLLNRRWTFRDTSPMMTAGLRFLKAFAVAYGINLGIVLGCIHWLQINSYVAQVSGVPPYTIAFFLLCKYHAFGASGLSVGTRKA
jgi:putative flippase GtrA